MARFKATEWMMKRGDNGKLEPTVTKRMLQRMLLKHHKDYLINKYGGWKRSDVALFLNLNHWLYPSNIKEFHIRTCISILREMVNVEVR